MAAFTLPVFYIWYLIIIGQETSAYDKPFRRNNIPVFIANQLTEGYYYLRNANETNRIVKLTKNTELTNSEYDGPDVDFSDPVSLQPCTQHDTCRGRCIEHQEEPEAVAEVAHFNCYCDSECEIFRYFITYIFPIMNINECSERYIAWFSFPWPEVLTCIQIYLFE